MSYILAVLINLLLIAHSTFLQITLSSFFGGFECSHSVLVGECACRDLASQKSIVRAA